MRSADQTFDILEPIISSLSKTFTAKDVTDNLDGTYTLTTCNTLWLHPSKNKTITITGAFVTDYIVVDMKANEWVKLKGSIAPEALIFDIYPVFPFHGTVLAQRELLTEIGDSENKMPMAWLHEITEEDNDNNPRSNVDFVSKFDIYFLTDWATDAVDVVDGFTTEHDKYAIKPMRNLANAFLDALDMPRVNNQLTTWQTYGHAKFGEYLEKQGHVKQVFDDYTSGVQLRMRLTILKDYKCLC